MYEPNDDECEWKLDSELAEEVKEKLKITEVDAENEDSSAKDNPLVKKLGNEFRLYDFLLSHRSVF